MSNKGNTQHGLSKSLTYRRWKSMRQRAASVAGRYADVTCCPEWASFEAFLMSMGECPPGHTLDREDNSKGYEPGNCRWATVETQNRNRSHCINLTFRGKTQIITAWADELGISADLIYKRIGLGWTTERALTQPPKARNGRRQAIRGTP